jgi:hypothetical protein
MKKILIFALPLLMAGCYPNGPDYIEQLDLVVTNYNPDYDFSSKTTFSIPDNVVIITGENLEDPDGNGQPDFVSEPYNSQIINTIINELEDRGWTNVDTAANPDVWILPTAMSSTTIVYYYDYWGYWGWWGGGYYGWYYPGYYPTVVGSYTTGSVFVTMVDRNALTPDNSLPVEWGCILNGLLTGSSSTNTASRITSGIEQAFEQSPYLNH